MWKIIGIDETKNKMEIKEAYMIKLQKINPEDDEEGFKKLRAAYEEAMRFADSEDTQEDEDITPMGIWIKKVKEIYNRFSLRIDENAWVEILESDVCFGIDSREEASSKLLGFLMDYYYLPKKIWLLLDDYFSFGNKREELIENFPENFINYVMDKVNSNYSDNLDYYLFERIADSKDYDAWISLYFKIQREISSRNMDEVEKDLREIEEFNIKHPLLESLYLRYYLAIEENEKARKIGEGLLKLYPNEDFALYGVAEVEWQTKNYEVAKEYYKKVLEIKPDNYNAKVGLADCYLETEDYKEAERIFEEILDRNQYDNYVKERLFIAANKCIEELEKECDSNNEDKKMKFKLGWYYFGNYRYEDIIKLCSKFQPDKEDENQYFDLLSRTYFAKDDFDLALEYLSKFEENLKSNEISSDNKQKEFQLLYYEKGRILTQKEEYEEALVCYDKALEIQKDHISTLNNKSYVLNKLKKYEDSLEIIEKALELDYNDVSLHINKCEALFELRYYKEAMDECNSTIDIYAYYTNPYLIKMKIYFIYDEYDEILEIADEVKRLNLSDDDINIYKIKALRNKCVLDEAENFALNTLEEKKEKNLTDNIKKLYYELAAIKYDKGDFEKALEYINMGIKSSNYDEDNLYFRAATYRCLKNIDLAIKDYDTIIGNNKTGSSWFPISKKAEIFDEIGKLDKALDFYKEVLKLDPENRSANNSIGEIYERWNDDQKALEYFNKQLEIEKSVYYYVHRGLLYARNDKFEEAKADYECAIELDSEDPYAYNNIGCLFNNINKFEEAIPYFEQAIEKSKDREDVKFYNNIADGYIGLDNNAVAIKYYDEGIKFLENEESLYYNKGKLLKKMILYKDAIEVYKKGLEIEGVDLEDFYDEISSSYNLIKEYIKALEWSKKVIEINPKTKYGYKNIGRIFDDLKDYKNAIKYYKLQIKQDKEDPINYLLLAETYEKIGKKIYANWNYNTSLEKFLKVEEKTAFEYSNIGSCYKGLKKTDEALENLKIAINMKLCSHCKYKACYDGYYALGEVYEQDKKYEEALKYYKKALETDEDDEDCIAAIERIQKLLK